MFDIDWGNLQLYHYMAMGGGGLAVLAVILYFVVPKGVKIPVGILSTVAGLVAGVGIGVIGMAVFGYEPRKPTLEGEAAAPVGAPGPSSGPPGGKGMMPPGPGGPGMGAPGGFGGGKGKGKGQGPTAKTQLALLVGKMEQLTDKPLTLKLTDEQRVAIGAQLKDLAEKEELADDDAKTRLDAILAVVKDNRKTLEAAGFRWPEGGGGGFQMPAPAPPNPFKDGEARERLLSLQGTLGTKK